MWKEGIFWVFPISPHHFLPITFWVISCLACPLCIQQGGLLLAQGIRNTARGLDKDMHSTLCLPLWGKHANVNVMDGVRQSSDKGYEYFWWHSKIPWPSCSYWCPGAWGTRASVATGWNYIYFFSITTSSIDVFLCFVSPLHVASDHMHDGIGFIYEKENFWERGNVTCEKECVLGQIWFHRIMMFTRIIMKY